MTEQQPHPFAADRQFRPEERTHTLGETFGAAFRQENDMLNMARLLSADTFEPDPAFNLMESGPKSRFWLDHSQVLARAQSAAEFRSLEMQIEQETADRALLASQGLTGMAAGMAAGILSPLMFVPMVGPSRGAKGVAEAFALAAGVATAQEATLFLSQATRTPQEAAFGIAGGTVLGGILGSAAVLLRRQDFDKIARDMSGDVDLGPNSVIMQRPDGSLVRIGERPVLQGLDQPVSPRAVSAAAEPPGPPNTVRLYLADDQVLFDRPQLQSDRAISYVDLPADDPRILAARGPSTPDAPAPRVQLTAEELDQAQELVREAGRPFPDPGAPPEGGSSIGAKATMEQPRPMIRVVAPDGKETWEELITPDMAPVVGDMKEAGAIGRIAAFMSPVLRSINQYDMPVISPVARRVMAQLSDAGVQLKGNERGLVGAYEGTVEARLNYYDALAYRAYKKLEDEYLNYLYDGAQLNKAQRQVARARMELNNAPQGKLGYQDFKAEVSRALNQGDQSPIPHVQRIAQAWRQDFFEEINKAAQEAADRWGAKRLYEEIDTDIDKSYFSRVHDANLINQNRDEYIKLVADHYESVLTGTFDRRVQRLLEREARDMDYEEVMKLERAEADALYENTRQALEKLRRPEEMDARVDEIADLRQQARDLVDEEFERLEAQNNPHALPEASRSNRNLARERKKEEAEALRDRANELEAQLPDEVKDTKAERKKLQVRLSALNESFGRFEARQARAYEQIERNEALTLNAYDRVVRATKRLVRDMGKLDEKKLAKELARLEKSWEAATKAARRGEERIVDLENRHLFSGLGRDQLDEEALKQAKREARESRSFDRLSGALLRDRDALVKQVEERLAATIEYTNKLNTRRAERNAALRQRAGKYDPEQVARRLEARAAGRTAAREALEQAAYDAGGIGAFDGSPSPFSFKETAEEMATHLANKITGFAPRIAGIDAMADMAVGLRSPMKMRALDIPYEQLSKFLEKDAEKILARYSRTVGADIELFRAFGDRTGGKAKLRVAEDMDRIDRHLRTREVDQDGKKVTEARRQKDIAKFLKARKRRMDELDAIIDRTRLLRGLPSDPNSLSYRMGRMFMNMNVATMMGTATVTSIPDAGRSVMAHGLMRTFGDSWMPFVRSMVDESAKPFKAHMIREARLAGIGIDVFTQNRAKGTFDIFGYDVNQSKFEQAWEYAAHKMPTVALFGPWTDAMKTLTASTTMARMMRSVQDVAEGRASPDDINYLAQAGLDPNTVQRIYGELTNGRGGTRYKDVILPNTESWDDYGALRAFQAAMSREDARMVISPGFERPLWMDASMLGRMVAQFRSFTMAANTKMLVAGLQTRNMAALHTLQGTVFSLALGALSYYIWAITVGGRSLEEMRNASWETWVDQAIYRSGVLGVFSEAQAIGSQIPATRPFTTFANSDIAGRRADSIIGAIAGPSFGKAWDISALLAQIDDPTEATVRQARKLLPYQNVFYLRQALTEIEAAAASHFPERRQ